jgi:transposase
MEPKRILRRRTYSVEFKRAVIDECRRPGASVASIALSHGMNANIAHRWLKEFDRGSLKLPMPVVAGTVAGEFVALEIPRGAEDRANMSINIELQRGSTKVAVTWPLTAANECAAWLKELLR